MVCLQPHVIAKHVISFFFLGRVACAAINLLHLYVMHV
jgi:hypothetical protein